MVHLPPPPVATTLVRVDGTTYQKGGDYDDELWHVRDRELVPEGRGALDCRIALDLLEGAVTDVAAGPATTLTDYPAESYTLTYDPAVWPAARRTAGASASMEVALVTQGLLGLRTSEDAGTVETLIWWRRFPIETVAPPEDETVR